MKKLLLTTAFMVAGALSSQAATLLSWDFTGENNTATSTAEVTDANLDVGGLLTRGPGAGSSVASNAFRTTGFSNNGVSTANTDYFQFQLSAAPGYTMSFDSIDAAYAGTSSYSTSTGAGGGVTYNYAYSLDGTNFTFVGATPPKMTGNGSMPQIDLSGISDLQNVAAGTTVTFRYYASGNTTTGGWGYTNTAPLLVSGEVVPEPGTALLLGLGLAGVLYKVRRRGVKHSV